jgi:hypothetical protein
MRHILRPSAERFHVAVARRHCVCHENEIELCPLCGLGKFQEVGKILSRVDLRIRMQPCGDMLPHGGEMRPQGELSFRLGHTDILEQSSKLEAPFPS